MSHDPLGPRCEAHQQLITSLFETVSNLALAWSQFLAEPTPENCEKVTLLHYRYLYQFTELESETRSLNRALTARNN